MSPREIAGRPPEGLSPGADACLTCDYFDRAEVQYPDEQYPTIRRMLARNRARHIEDGECARPGAPGE
ncbi:hypothetical protein [Kitasatospora cathayae]|uniref:Uncharacterized protein n=1 Tax=Kitasatospora cathayae TaxID=3004092 RepID=A0ABY7Q625_9ACTN|nr:hypothetical protein [Kitasatospora sp. HUAS 3-15]WBP87711.1 hypothetical protein O1G21_18920 [Kitasatospora sp. HUAS 3-15]